MPGLSFPLRSAQLEASLWTEVPELCCREWGSRRCCPSVPAVSPAKNLLTDSDTSEELPFSQVLLH